MSKKIPGEFPLEGEAVDIDFEILMQLPLSEVVEKVVEQHNAQPGSFLELYGQVKDEPDTVYLLGMSVISVHKKQ